METTKTLLYIAMSKSLIFPVFIELNDYGGNFEEYFEAIFNIFKEDFITNQPKYNNLRVTAKKYPEEEGMHKTFYHITHKGDDEKNREPDLERMKRIRFPKFVIDNNKHNDILIWKNRRGRDKRILMLNETESYIVILSERKKYYLFITAYFIEREHQRKKLLKEYTNYIKAETA